MTVPPARWRLLAPVIAVVCGAGCLDFPQAPPRVDASVTDVADAADVDEPCDPEAPLRCARCLPDGREVPCSFGCDAAGACVDAIAVSAGGHGACALLDGGAVTCWGDPARTTGPIALPAAAVEVVVGGARACARLDSGAVHCWTDGAASPVTLPGPASRLGEATGPHHCAWIAEDGVYCWSDGVPAPVGLPPRVQASAVGEGHGCLVDTGGGVWCWGEGDVAQLGNGIEDEPRDSYRVLTGLPTNQGWLGVFVGGDTSCAWNDADEVWCWGANGEGQGGVYAVDPVDPPRMTSSQFGAGVATAVHGGLHACLIDGDGAVQCWGRAKDGAVGPFADFQPHRAAVVPGLGESIALGVGDGFACAVGRDGVVRCWGNNDAGQLGVSEPDASATPLVVGPL